MTAPESTRESARESRLGAGGIAFVLCLAVLTACGIAGLLAKRPLLFPSLGPTVMLFFTTPTDRSAAVRSALAGHLVAILAGAGCLALFGLTTHESVLQEGLTAPRIAAAALSVAVTTLVLALLGTPHPPAGATTLIVSLGLITSAAGLASIAVAVVLVTVLSVVLNRLRGVRQPL